MHLESGSVTDTLAFLQSQLTNTVSLLNSGIQQIHKKQGIVEENEKRQEKSRILDPAKHVFATLLTDDGYLPGVQLLHYSLQKHVNRELERQDTEKKVNEDLDADDPLQHDEFSERRKNRAFQLIVICSDNLSIVTHVQLKKLANVIIKKVGSIPNPFEAQNSTAGADGKVPSWVGSAYTKLHLWSLCEYSLVYYIDADCLVQSIKVLRGFI